MGHSSKTGGSTPVLRASELFFRTLHDDPADAEARSHALLIRAGYIRKAAAGIYTWLPLGLMVLRRVEAIVRDEMRSIGAQEVSFPALLPREPYDVTGRWEEFEKSIFRLQDRRGADYLLGPTHEEMFTLLVKDLYSSYKDLPLSIYQIQTKYRDEVRPRGGLLRGREFVMKDSYSFSLDSEGLEKAYADHRAAYQRIFDRLGLKYVIAKATAGAMGGSQSEEFLATLDAGEDTYRICDECGSVANQEVLDETGTNACAECGSTSLSEDKGIELGHIFQLGTKYAEALGLRVADSQGKIRTVSMGSYGIGISRIVAALVEASADERGIVWPESVAPLDVHVISLGKSEEIKNAGEAISARLAEAGLAVLYDDRAKVGPGAKLNDADLLGIPWHIVAGRGIAQGEVELRNRRSGEITICSIDEAVESFR